MKNTTQVFSFFSSLFLTFILSSSLSAQEWQTPLIKGYGEIKYFDQTAQQPDPSGEYKLLFDIKSDQLKAGVNKGLWIIARTLNLLHVGEVPAANVKLVVSFHGYATYAILNEKSYKKKFGESNPNLDLIAQLRKNGVSIYICSQALAARNISFEDIHSEVVPAISALAVVSNYQLKGYHLMPM
jgi:intracellular sulfur oxidation DsrE/DsrF family protein